MVNGEYENVDDEKKYWIGISDFLSGGGDGYDMIRDERLFYQKGKDDATVLVDEIKKRNPITDQNTGKDLTAVHRIVENSEQTFEI